MSYLRLGIGRVADTMGHLRDHQDLAALLLAVFFSTSGISIVISYTFIYGAQVIGWNDSVRTLTFVLVQITAAAGAFGFGYLQDRLGARRTYKITLIMWMTSILLIYLTPLLAEGAQIHLGLDWQAQYLFLIVSCIAGTSLGACQSTTRTLVGLFSPRSRAAEMFGFWGLSMKLAGVFGLLAIGLLQAALGLHNAVLFCTLLFLMALLIVDRVDETRGRATAVARDTADMNG